MTPTDATTTADDATAAERSGEGRADPADPSDRADRTERTDRTDRSARTSHYWYVALFSIPPGVGVAGFVASATGEAVSPLAVATGLVTTLAIAGFVLLGIRSGEGAG